MVTGVHRSWLTAPVRRHGAPSDVQLRKRPKARDGHRKGFVPAPTLEHRIFKKCVAWDGEFGGGMSDTPQQRKERNGICDRRYEYVHVSSFYFSILRLSCGGFRESPLRASIFYFVACAAALAVPVTARAETESTATSTITITIPPLAEAMEAEASGATGAWTVSSQGQGFMVGVISTRNAGGDETKQLSVLSGELSRVDVHLTSDGVATGLEGRIDEADGALTTYVYPLPASVLRGAKADTQILFSAI